MKEERINNDGQNGKKSHSLCWKQTGLKKKKGGFLLSLLLIPAIFHFVLPLLCIMGRHALTLTDSREHQGDGKSMYGVSR